jgi:hypothetical protein
VSAVKSDRDGTDAELILQADQASAVIREEEGRHDIARTGGIVPCIVVPQPVYKRINRCLKIGPQPAHLIGEGLQPFRQRSVHIAAMV